jgi:hypothetical protein
VEKGTVGHRQSSRANDAKVTRSAVAHDFSRRESIQANNVLDTPMLLNSMDLPSTDDPLM